MTNKQYEKKEKAKKINLIDFLHTNYPDMICYNREKQEWRVPDTHIKIIETSYYDFDTGTGGDNIRFLTDIMGLSFFDAIKELTESKVKSVDLSKITFSEYERPENSFENEKAYDYLKVRGIKEEIVRMCINDGFVYMDKRLNIIFHNPVQEFCILRSTYADWKGIQSESVYGYWEISNGNSKEVYIFEAPIDALSYMSIYDKKGIYVAMGGLKKGTIEHIKKDFKGYELNLCVDWDDKGNQFAQSYPEIKRIKGTKGKDWNDELKNS